MPGAGYFAGMVGAIILGLIALVVAGLIFFLALPYLAVIFVGGIMLLLGFLMIFILTYVALFIGVAIYYAIMHPMKVEKKDKKYSISKAKEAGMRQKGGKG